MADEIKPTLRHICDTLNTERVISPWAQQRRPAGWAPSSVRVVLLRSLYRGVIIWNKTRKRNTWGLLQVQTRAEADWIRVPAPALTIVSDAAWTAAHERLRSSRHVSPDERRPIVGQANERP